VTSKASLTATAIDGATAVVAANNRGSDRAHVDELRDRAAAKAIAIAPAGSDRGARNVRVCCRRLDPRRRRLRIRLSWIGYAP
jgi:hypothetical protein